MRRYALIGIASLLFCLLCLFPVQAGEIDKTAVSPFADYCDGYGMPGAKGPGYVSVLKVSTGVVEKGDDDLLDAIVAYDRAEADDAYVGQINMITASSFNGLAGSIWGYDLARAGEIAQNSQKPLFTVKQYDGTELKVYDGAPLLKAGQALFGTEKARRFPLLPGAHVICANKSGHRLPAQKGRSGSGPGLWGLVLYRHFHSKRPHKGRQPFHRGRGPMDQKLKTCRSGRFSGRTPALCGQVHRGLRPGPERGL